MSSSDLDPALLAAIQEAVAAGMAAQPLAEPPPAIGLQMAITPKLGLKQPALDDPALITDLNDNMTILDNAITADAAATLTNKTLVAPVITNPTITGWSNAVHNHLDPAGAGILDGASIGSGFVGSGDLVRETALTDGSFAGAELVAPVLLDPVIRDEAWWIAEDAAEGALPDTSLKRIAPGALDLRYSPPAQNPPVPPPSPALGFAGDTGLTRTEPGTLRFDGSRPTLAFTTTASPTPFRVGQYNALDASLLWNARLDTTAAPVDWYRDDVAADSVTLNLGKNFPFFLAHAHPTVAPADPDDAIVWRNIAHWNTNGTLFLDPDPVLPLTLLRNYPALAFGADGTVNVERHVADATIPTGPGLVFNTPVLGLNVPYQGLRPWQSANYSAFQIGKTGALTATNFGGAGIYVQSNSYVHPSGNIAIDATQGSTSLGLTSDQVLLYAAPPPVGGSGGALVYALRLHMNADGTFAFTPKPQTYRPYAINTDGNNIAMGQALQWHSSYVAIDMPGGALFADRTAGNRIELSSNSYVNTAGNLVPFVGTIPGCKLQLYGGQLYYVFFPTVAAGATQSAIMKFSIDQSGVVSFWPGAGPSATISAGAANGNARFGSTAASSRMEIYGTGCVPFATDFMFLGEGAYRWASVYAASGTVSTSHISAKDAQSITPIDPAKALAAFRRTTLYDFDYKDPPFVPVPPEMLPPDIAYDATDDNEKKAEKKAKRDAHEAQHRAGYEERVAEAAKTRRGRHGVVLGSPDHPVDPFFMLGDDESFEPGHFAAGVAAALKGFMAETEERLARLEAAS